jgi:hypothetical protein
MLSLKLMEAGRLLPLMAKTSHSSQFEKKGTREIVLLLHGIRTNAGWYQMVSDVIQKELNFKVEPLKYDYFDAIRFLCPVFTRNKPIRKFIQEYHDIRNENPGVPISVIAHSFGTYAISKALKQDKNIEFNRIIFCGSIVPSKFRIADYRSQLGEDPILNDYGVNDVYPVVAKAVTFGYGATGTFGFGTTGIRDRMSRFSHSEYFNRPFVEDYWIPFLRDGTIKKTELDSVGFTSPYWQTLLSSAPLNWVFLGLISYFSWNFISDQFRGTPLLDMDSQIFVGQWVGVPRVSARLHITNPTFSSQVFLLKGATLYSPDKKKKIALNVNNIYQCNGMTPTSMIINSDPFKVINCDVNFVGDMSSVAHLEKDIEAVAVANKISPSTPPDLNSDLIQGKLLESLHAAAEKNFSWTPGEWRIKITYTNGVEIGNYMQDDSSVGYFYLQAEDIRYFKNETDAYKSGVGIFWWWLNIGPTQMRLLQVYE